MEDAIALAKAFDRHGEDVAAAGSEYELERRPAVEALQEAALESMEYFEEVPRHWGLPPLQFAFNLLTRSGRIGHANLSVRDPRLVRRVDAFLGGRGALAPPPLFAPLELGGLRLANRAVAPGLDDRSGAGLMLSPGVAVTPDGRITPDDPVDPAGWREDLERIRAAGGTAMLALNHAGRRGAWPAPRRWRRPPAARGRMGVGLGLPDPLRPPQRDARRAGRDRHGADPRRVRRRGAARR